MAETSAFAICAGETTLGSECDARCGEGFYATAGSGVATFTCEKEFGGAWVEQGHPFYESSLICARCPAIENCVVSSCATGTDAVCTECAAKYTSFRLNEQPTRCLSDANTAATDGLTSDATGIIVFGIPPGTTLRAGGDGRITIGTAASLTVHGAADGTSVLDVDALDVEGAATLLGVAMHDAELSVGAGASLAMTLATCGGATTLRISGTATITDSSLSFESAGVIVSGTATFMGGSLSFAAGVLIGIDVQQGGAATATGTTFQTADDATVAVRVPVGGSFASVDSQLVDTYGGSTPMWSTDVVPCDCGGHGDSCVSPRGDCECAAAFSPSVSRLPYPNSLPALLPSFAPAVFTLSPR